MNIVVLFGSPRPKGNTAAMVEAFVEGAKEAGHQVSVIDVAKKNIKGCLACEYCHNKGNGTCIQKDDMQEIYPALNEAEILVLASPIYYFTMSAQIQLPLQRFYAIQYPHKVKKAVLLLSSHSPNVYDASIRQFESILGYCGFQNGGVITACEGENKTEAKLAEVKALAKSL
ncbi:MAG: flavodoxin family protein [bacterium]|nr:flavodoxin family protein [bacterium]